MCLPLSAGTVRHTYLLKKKEEKEYVPSQQRPEQVCHAHLRMQIARKGFGK